MTHAHVAVEVATVWTSPDAPRDVDGLAVADMPDVPGWLSGLDAELRLGLHGRTLTQLLSGEPVEIVETAGDWARIEAPWQPDPGSGSAGYVGWVRQAHLSTGDQPDERDGQPAGPVPPDRIAVLAQARQFLGLRYLWGGLSRYGMDCSGLVHYSYRQAGVVVPRDAYAQAAAVKPVELGNEEPGDLYFFAREGGRVFHVGFVTGERVMLHAPETGGLIEDVPIAPERLPTLVSAGRFLG